MLLVTQGQHAVLTSQQKMHHRTWIIDLLSKALHGLRHVLFRVSQVRAVTLFFIDTATNISGLSASLLIFFFFYCSLHETSKLMWKPYVANVHFCSCFQEKSTAFDFLDANWKRTPIIGKPRCCVWPCVHSVAWWVDDCLPFPDSGQQGVWGVVIALP